MIKARLEDWSLVRESEDSDYHVLTGKIYDNPYFEDGETIVTSKIIDAREYVARN